MKVAEYEKRFCFFLKIFHNKRNKKVSCVESALFLALISVDGSCFCSCCLTSILVLHLHYVQTTVVILHRDAGARGHDGGIPL